MKIKSKIENHYLFGRLLPVGDYVTITNPEKIFFQDIETINKAIQADSNIVLYESTQTGDKSSQNELYGPKQAPGKRKYKKKSAGGGE